MKIKRMIKVFSALFVLAGLSFTSCAPDADGGLPSQSNPSLSLTGRIYTENTDKNGNYYYTENITNNNKVDVTINNGVILASGRITNGHLSIDIPAPFASDISSNNFNASVVDVVNYGTSGFTSIVVTPSGTDSAKYATLSFSNSLNRRARSGSNNNGTNESVIYVYVDKPVTVTATGIQPNTTLQTHNYYNLEGGSLRLETGWNAILTRVVSEFTVGSTFATDRQVNRTTISVGSPDLRWVQ